MTVEKPPVGLVREATFFRDVDGRPVEEIRTNGARQFDGVTLADLCLIPQLDHSRRLGIDLKAYPTLLAVEATCAELPAFLAARPEVQPDAESQ